MATHAESKNQGTIITGSTITIENLNSTDSGLSPESVLGLLPKEYDLSDQCDGSLKDFVLSPAVASGTLSFFNLYLDGVRLTRSSNLTDPDYFIVATRNRLQLHQTFPAPSTGSSLIAIYIGVVL